MAKGARAPSHNAYRGSIGRTRTRAIHVTAPSGDLVVATATVSIDAVADPELVTRLHTGTLNSLELDGGVTVAIHVPIVYHDPAAELLVLVLGDGDRHREVAERIRLLQDIDSDGGHVPAYAKDFAVVFGASGLAAYLERRAKDALAQVDAQREIGRTRADAERARGDADKARGELDKLRGDADQTRSELAAARAELVDARAAAAATRAELGDARAELDRLRAAATAPSAASGGATVVTAMPSQLRHDPPTDQIAVAQADIERTRQALDPAALRRAVAVPAISAADETHDLSAYIAPREPESPSTQRLELVDPDLEVIESADAPPVEPAPARAPEHRPSEPPRPPPMRSSRGSIPGVTSLGSATHTVPPTPAPAAAVPAEPAPPAAVPADERRATSDFDKITTDVRTAGELAKEPLSGTGFRVEVDDEQTQHGSPPASADPLTTQTLELPLPAGSAFDAWIELAATAPTSSFTVDGNGPRLAVLAGEPVARTLSKQLDVRIVLFRLPTYPVVALAIGAPIAFRAPHPDQLVIVPLDVGTQADRDLLGALSASFRLRVDIIKRGKLMRSVSLVAPLADNAGYVLRAAEDHLRGITADGSAASFDRARDAVMAAGFDVLGSQHAEAAEFRDDKLAQLDTAQHLRRAVAMARRFARPAREDYLVCTRGFPLKRWHELRRHVVQIAVTWGIWMGPELAQVAVSEGFARSRRDLIVRLDAGFDALRRHPTAFDIDQDAADDNLKALAEEAKALGVELKKAAPVKNGHIASDDVVAVAGSIEHTPTASVPKGMTVEELMLLLDDRSRRVSAALELCERGDARAAGPVIGVVQKLSRAEAVRVLGSSVRFGGAAADPLLAGLKSNKAFLRHGCALALAMLRTEAGTQAVIELLLEEPTEVWREIARAVGQIGQTALMPLAAQAGRLNDRLTPAIAERVAWAMAHVAVRGGKTALEALAAGHSVVAPVARKAIDLVELATNDHTLVRNNTGGDPPRDVTVNRAFSRRFFEALDQAAPPGLAPGIGEMSSPMETLDEADLMAAEEEEQLDESDLIQP
jgi:hypothetical protein